jgi:hypothetical protein
MKLRLFDHVEQALMVRAKQGFEETIGKRKRVHKPGDRWLVYGPGDYFPPIEVQVLEMREAFLQIESLNIYMFYSKFSFLLFIVIVLLLSIIVPRKLGYI